MTHAYSMYVYVLVLLGAYYFFTNMFHWSQDYMNVTWLFIHVTWLCIRVKWRIHMWDTTHSCSIACLLSLYMCVPLFSRIWMRGDVFICVTWRIDTGHETWYVRHDSFIFYWVPPISLHACSTEKIMYFINRISCILYEAPNRISYVFYCVPPISLHACSTILLYEYDVTESFVWHDVFIFVTRLIHYLLGAYYFLLYEYDVTESFVWHDLFVCLTRLMKRLIEYGVATTSRLLKIIGFFCKRAL